MKWILNDDLVDKLYQQARKTEEYILNKMYSKVMDLSYEQCPLMSSDFYLHANKKFYYALVEHNNYIRNLSKEEFLSEIINKLELIKMEVDIIFDKMQNHKFKIDGRDIIFGNAMVSFSNRSKENIFYIEFFRLDNIFNSLEINIKDNDINFKIIKLKDSIPELQTMVEIMKKNQEMIFSKIKLKSCSNFIESLIFFKQLNYKMFKKGIPNEESLEIFENFKEYYFKNKHDIIECIDKIYLQKDIKIDF